MAMSVLVTDAVSGGPSRRQFPDRGRHKLLVRNPNPNNLPTDRLVERGLAEEYIYIHISPVLL